MFSKKVFYTLALAMFAFASLGFRAISTGTLRTVVAAEVQSEKGCCPACGCHNEDCCHCCYDDDCHCDSCSCHSCNCCDENCCCSHPNNGVFYTITWALVDLGDGTIGIRKSAIQNDALPLRCKPGGTMTLKFKILGDKVLVESGTIKKNDIRPFHISRAKDSMPVEVVECIR